MPIIPFINLKGGVAKTTNAVAVAERLACNGFKVLVIDADHQCTTGELLLGENRLWNAERRRTTLHDLLLLMLDDDFDERRFDTHVVEGGSNIKEAQEHLSVIPCSYRIDDLFTNVAKAKHGFPTNQEFHAVWKKRRKALYQWLDRTFHYTIIDCPPSAAQQQVKLLLRVAYQLIIPSVPDRLSVRGTLHLMDRIAKLKLRAKPLGLLWSLYREQVAVHRSYVYDPRRRIRRLPGLPLPFRTVIPNASQLAAAGNSETTFRTFNAKYRTQFAKLYTDLCVEIRERAVPSRQTPNAENVD